MRNCIWLLFISGLLHTSCNQDDDVLTETPTELADEIHYINLDPDSVLRPVISVGSHPSGCAKPIPFPADSSVTINLDINLDGENDFLFRYRTLYQFLSVSSPCSNYGSYVSVAAVTGSGNKVIVSEPDFYPNKLISFDNGELITSDNFTENQGYVFYEFLQVPFPSFHGFSGEGYIGIKLAGGELGWIKINLDIPTFTCSILEYAFNTNPESSIEAGQME
jgi:hypothetical protein